MMIFVVKIGVNLVKVGGLVEHAFVKSVISAVIRTAVFAQSAELAELYAERVRAAFALIAYPVLAVTAFAAMVAVVLALAVFLIAFAAFLTVLPTVAAHMTAFAVFVARGVRAFAALLADVLAAMRAVLALVGTLTGFSVAFAAVGAVITAVHGALFADTARFAEVNALAERTFGAFGANVCLKALGAMLAAVADFVLDFKIGVVLCKLVSYRVYAAVRAHYKALFYVDGDTFLTLEPLRRFVKRGAVFASVAVFAMGNVAVIGIYARFHTVGAVKPELIRAKLARETVFAYIRAAFAHVAVEA